MFHLLIGLLTFNILKAADVITRFSTDPRIIGGKDASSIPWIVPLVRSYMPLQNMFYGRFCGGSIIHENWVLTAAHCLEGLDPSDLYVVGGVVDLTDTSNAQQRNVHSIRIHEDYDDRYLWNDIALLELESPFCLDDHVAMIDAATDDDPYVTGQMYTVAGWGVRAYDPNWQDMDNFDWDTSTALQELEGYPHQDEDYCDDFWQNWAGGFDLFDATIQLCAGGIAGQDSCFGDSGGPLWMDVNDIPVLYGIVSYGTGCASNDPTVNTRVSAFQAWIESYIGKPYSEFNAGLEYYTVKGYHLSQCTEATNPTCTTQSVNQNELRSVRCCADTDPNGWHRNAWLGCSVYAESRVPKCYTTDWESAVETCDNEGARLCTKEELEAGCTFGSGCGFNWKMVWSSTVSAQYYIVKGHSGSNCLETSVYGCNPRPVSKNEIWNVRCCTETDPGGWLINNGCSIYTASPQCTATDWESANELCISQGARLCTREELESGCAGYSGCQFNYYMVWSANEYLAEC